MEVDQDSEMPSSSSSRGEKKRFDIVITFRLKAFKDLLAIASFRLEISFLFFKVFSMIIRLVRVSFTVTYLLTFT